MKLNIEKLYEQFLDFLIKNRDNVGLFYSGEVNELNFSEYPSMIIFLSYVLREKI